MVVCRICVFCLLAARYPFRLSLSKLRRCLVTGRAELVEAWFSGGYCVPLFRAEAGSRPARDSLSFASPKESKQRKGDPQSATPSLRCGANLRRGDCGVRRGTRFAAAQRRSDSRGESVDEAAAHWRDCHPATAPAHAQPEGGGAPNIRTATRVIAALGPAWAAPSANGAWLREALAPAKWGRAKQRPEWMSAPTPLCMRRGAQGLADQGSRLSERSEFERDPAKPEHRRLPEAERRDADSGVALSLVTFFRRRERKLLARRATPGLRPQHGHAVTTKKPGFDKLSPNGLGRYPGFDRLSPNGRGSGALASMPPARTAANTIKNIATGA
ncbi:hypothetical protein BSY15_586 [Acidovorax sp. RAC01]|nr:hypothetical protein BSY15_586 [Acidovorax sp. RAC01]